VKAAVALVLSGAALTVQAQGSTAWNFEVAGQQEWQQWRETASDDRRLVAEDGRLGGLAGSFRWEPPEGMSVALRVSALRGVRDYRGVTNLGSAAATRSDASHALVRLEALFPARWAAAGSHWQPLVAIEGWQWQRRLRDVGMAWGYRERYRQGAMWVGLHGQSESGWLAQLEVGGGTGGHNRIKLPGRDPARLPLGLARSWRATLGAPLASHWHWQVSAEQLTLGKGREQAITLQGVPVQSAHQPRTELHRLQFQLSWRP
jgi:hypothetical protein